MTTAIDPTKTRPLMEFKHGRPFIGCRFDPAGRYLFASSEDDSIVRFDLLTREKVAFTGHASWVRGLTFKTTSGPMVPSASVAALAVHGSLGAARAATQFAMISGDYHGNLVWWNGIDATPKPLRTVAAHTGWIRAVAISLDRKTLATCGNDHLVKLWNADDGRAIATLEGHSSHVYNVAFHPNGTRLVSADLMGTIKDWDLTKGTVVRELDAKVLHKYDNGFAADIGGIRGIAFDPEGKQFAGIGITNVSNAFAGVGNPLVVLFDWAEGKAKLLKLKTTFQGTGWGVDFLPNGMIVGAGGGGQGRIWFWNAASGENVHTFNVPTNARDMAVHPDGTAIAIAGSNGTCYVYSMTLPPPAATPAKK